METTEDFDAKRQNEIVTRWVNLVRQRLKISTSGFTHGKERSVTRKRSEKKLTTSIRSETKQTFGVIDRASIIFERHGVFVHKGVGRGYQMSNGIVIRTAKSVSPAVTRRPVEWFNPVINQLIPEIVKDLEEVNENAVINAIRLVIK